MSLAPRLVLSAPPGLIAALLLFLGMAMAVRTEPQFTPRLDTLTLERAAMILEVRRIVDPMQPRHYLAVFRQFAEMRPPRLPAPMEPPKPPLPAAPPVDLSLPSPTPPIII